MVVEEYNAHWINQFNSIKNILKNNLSCIISIEHIGSTAIMGMCAKPIIDIDIVIKTDNDFNTIKKELETIGYYHNGNQGIIGREVFKRTGSINNETLDSIKHHLYVCKIDGKEYQRQIIFRNYLNGNQSACNEYRKIKMEIIGKYGNEDREKYVNAKQKEYGWFFEKILKEAGWVEVHITG
jgi:GrpB-like predicted nucleotidyltransferase (UPF0157 family)